MSNALEAPQEGEWGETVRHDDILSIAAQGFDTIRLPVRFSAHFDADSKEIDPAFLKRIDEVLRWAIDADLYVILDLHHFDELMEMGPKLYDNWHEIWRILGDRYAGWPDKLIFELLNEPHTEMTTEVIDPLFGQLITMLRAKHPTRWIITEGGSYAKRHGLAKLKQHDVRNAHSFHYYKPFKFTHQNAFWAEPVPPLRHPITSREKTVIAENFASLPSHSTPLFLGEFGVSDAASDADRADWIAHIRTLAEQQRIAWCYWGFSGSFGIFDQSTGLWNEKLLDALIPQD